MALATLDDISAALAASTAQRPLLHKTTNVGSQTIGYYASFWTISGAPTNGVAPTTAEACHNEMVGAVPLVNPLGSERMHLAGVSATAGGIASIEIHDRLGQMGGLDGTSTASQTVSLNLTTSGIASSGDPYNIVERKGAADYSEVRWWIEIYTPIGASLVTATIGYTDQNGTNRTANISYPTSSTRRMIPIIPTTAGVFIRSVNSLTLSASTGTVGDFGVTATVLKAEVPVVSPNVPVEMAWHELDLAYIPNFSCLMAIGNAIATTVQAPNAKLTIVQG